MNNSVANRLITIDTINTLGTAITWTGLPIFALHLTGSYIYTGSLYLTGTIAGIITTILSGHFIDKGSSKKIMATAFALNSLVMIMLFSFISVGQFLFLFPIMIISQSLGSFADLCLDVWYRDITEKDKNLDLAKSISKKNTYTMSCKTIGFTLGPLIFSLLNSYAIIMEAITFLISCIITIRMKTSHQIDTQNNNAEWFSIRYLVNIIKDSTLLNFLFTYALGGMIGPVVISLSIYTLESHFEVNDSLISLFWLIGGLGVIISNILLTKSNLLSLSKLTLYLLSLALISGGIIIMGVSSNPIYYIIGFSLMTFGNPIINTLLSAQAFKAIPQNSKAKIMGVMEASSEIGTLLFMAISWLLISYSGIFFTLMIIAFLATIRISIFYSSFFEVILRSDKSVKS